MTIRERIRKRILEIEKCDDISFQEEAIFLVFSYGKE